MTARSEQFDLVFRSWGGRRAGAGRRPAPGRRSVPHRKRVGHAAHCPAHVTLRAQSGLPSLRDTRTFKAVRPALRAASRRGFRVVQFSVQADHVHLLVESDSPAAFTRGVQGLAVRVARAVNRALGRRGSLWADRYHARLLRTPREVRNALVYVLQNWRKHVPGARGMDPRSSAGWFEGWDRGIREIRSATGPGSGPVAASRTWLVRVGWRRHGLIDPGEFPRRPFVRRDKKRYADKQNER
jgi:REP element-mobilizing transposase RayT